MQIDVTRVLSRCCLMFMEIFVFYFLFGIFLRSETGAADHILFGTQSCVFCILSWTLLETEQGIPPKTVPRNHWRPSKRPTHMQSEVLHKVAQAKWLYCVGGDYVLDGRDYLNFSAWILFFSSLACSICGKLLPNTLHSLLSKPESLPMFKELPKFGKIRKRPFYMIKLIFCTVHCPPFCHRSKTYCSPMKVFF